MPQIGYKTKTRQLISEWFERRHTSSMIFEENLEPQNDINDDYVIAYEVIFRPHSLDLAQVEIGVTSDGKVSIGFERWKRIAERLRTKTKYDRFVAGHEPEILDASGLLAIMDSIADGQISVSSKVMPLFGLVSAKAMIYSDALEVLLRRGYRQSNWLVGVDLVEDDLLRFRKW